MAGQTFGQMSNICHSNRFYHWVTIMDAYPTVKQLQHLVALARERNFSKAARAVSITQSTLSASIRELELALGAPVAERGSRLFHLTPLGEQVVERAQTVLAELRELTQLAREQAEPLTGTLRLGVIPTISPFLLPRLLPGLRARYPRLKLLLREGQTSDLLQQMEEGELDVLLLALPCECEGDYEVLAHDPFVVALRPDHPLAQEKQITTRALRTEGLLTLQDGHCLKDQVLSACGLRGPTQGSFAATSLHTLVQMVDNGLGITLVPHMAVKAGLLLGTKLVVRQVQGGAAAREIVLLWRKGSARAEEFRLLVAQFRKLFRQRKAESVSG
jgi:LysR family hydrogen peroxide-inducible transcriptional activator